MLVDAQKKNKTTEPVIYCGTPAQSDHSSNCQAHMNEE